MKILSGSGKNMGGSVRLPHEEANTLQSRAYARFVDLLCEGQIEGFCTDDGITCVDAELKINNYTPSGFLLNIGAVSVTNGSAIIQGDISVDWTAVTTVCAITINEVEYKITAVNPSLRQLTVTPVYAGSTSAGLPYEIREIQSFRISAGAIYLDPTSLPVEADGVISRKLLGVTSTPIVGESAGYPSSWQNQIKCSIEGDGTDALVELKTYPKTAAEQLISNQTIVQLAHGFIVGDRIQKLGAFWQKSIGFPQVGELRVVTGVTNANTFAASLEVFPQGRVRGLKLVNGGKNYTWAKITLPSAVLTAILFDDQPLASPSTLEPNFKDIRLEYRYGAEDQTVMPGFEQIEQVLPPSGAFEGTEVKYNVPHSRIIEGQYDRAIVDINLVEGFYVQNVKNGDIESVGNPDATPLWDFNDFVAGHLDYTVKVKIEQRFKRVTDPGDLSTREWYPFGRGTYVLAGKTMSPYVRSIEAALVKPEQTSKYQWEIRVTRVTRDDVDPARTSISEERRPFTKFMVDRITAITNLKLTYPFSALIGIEINAEQFARMPVRAYRVKLMKVQVPSNYFPPYSVKEMLLPNGAFSRTIRPFAEYNRNPVTGDAIFDVNGNVVNQIWDGTFYESWTNNPAWIAYAVCTDTRFGLGRHIQTTSKWKHYQIGRYNDETVLTGYNAGSYDVPEPRYTAGVYLQAKDEAHKFLTDLASCFSGYYLYSGGAAIPIQDRPKPIRATFTPSDVENGLFEYRGTQRRVRHTTAYVKFNDPDNGFKLTPVGYEDDEGILRYGIQPIEKTAFSVISRGQARRLAKKIIRMETSNTDTVSFATGVKGSILTPGEVIAIYDPVRSTLPYGGRILAINKDAQGRSALVLDRWFDIDPSTPATAFQLVLSKPTKQISEEDVTSELEADRMIQSQIVTLPIAAISEDIEHRRLVILNAAVPPEVKVGGVWGLQTAQVNPQLFTVIGIEEASKHKFVVSALEYHEELFANVDSDVPYSETSINPDLEGWRIPYPVRNLNLDVTSKKDQDITVFTLNVSWSKPERGFGLEYEVWLQKGLGNYQLQTVTKNTHVDFRLTEPDNYCIKIITIGLQGRKSTPVQQCTVIGSLQGTNKEIISGLEVKGQANNTFFSTADVEFDWRVNWSGLGTTIEEGSHEVPKLPPGVTQYELEILNPNSVVVGKFVTVESNFTLTFERNKALTAGPYRDFIISVRARTDDGNISAATQLRVKNLAPTAPGAPGATYTLVADTEGNAILTPTATLIPNDFAGIRVWVSTVSGFAPTDPILQQWNLTGISPVEIKLTLGSINYIRWALFDTISANNLDCNISAEYAITPNKEGRLSAFDFLKKR